MPRVARQLPAATHTERWDDGTVVTWLPVPFPVARKPLAFASDPVRRARVPLEGLVATQAFVTQAGVDRYRTRAACRARELGLPRPNGAPVAVAAAPRWPRAFVTVLSDGMSDSYGVLVFVGRSSMGRRRAEGASEAFAVARAAADDLLRRRVAGEVRLSFAVERCETRIEIRRLAPDGSVVVAPWHEPPRMNPSSETGHDQPHSSGGVPVSGAPPAAVRSAFSEGLRLYARGLGGAGLRPETVAWARRIARGEPPTPEKIIKMRAWFARHGASPTEVAARRRQQADLSRG